MATSALAAPKPCEELKAEIEAKIPGATQEQFEKLTNDAKEGCPVSKVLNAKITLDATLVS